MRHYSRKSKKTGRKTRQNYIRAIGKICPGFLSRPVITLVRQASGGYGPQRLNLAIAYSNIPVM